MAVQSGYGGRRGTLLLVARTRSDASVTLGYRWSPDAHVWGSTCERPLPRESGSDGRDDSARIEFASSQVATLVNRTGRSPGL
jgi:hypothetical protein